MMLTGHRVLVAALGCGLAFVPANRLMGQQSANPPAPDQPKAQAASQPSSGQDQEVDPLKRERSDKERFAAQRAVKQELKGAYKTWLTQDVAYIISDEE